MKTRRASIVAGLFASAVVAQSSAACSNVLVPSYAPPIVGSGWHAQLVLGGLTKPRSIEFDNTGALLVVESGVGISRHTFIDNGGTCLSLEKSSILVNEPTLNHGLAVSTNGRTIYASSAESVFSYNFNARSGTVGANPGRILINKMSNNDLVTRTLLLSKKQADILLVSRGVPDGDEAKAGASIDSGLSQIRSFDLDNLTTISGRQGVYDFNEDGDVLGWGLRNSVGVAEHPVSGGIWAVENSMDGVTRNGKDIHENNPGEELNYLGVLAANGSAGWGEDGPKNFGFPHCFAVWGLDEIPDNEGLRVGDQFAVDEEAGVTDEDCNGGAYVPPRLTLPAHYAPLDIKFNQEGSAAYVSFHGSFNTEHPVGYRLSSLEFDAETGQPKADPRSSHEALTDILTNPNHAVCPDNCFRPAGLTFDSAGRLWMTSDSTGEVFVLQRTAEDEKIGVFVMPEGGSKNGAGTLSEGWLLYAAVLVIGVFLL